MEKITKPKKADGSITNTWIVDIDGFETTYPEGKMKFSRKVITVRFTSDNLGETISFTDEAKGIQLQVPFKKIDEMVQLARERYKHETN